MRPVLAIVGVLMARVAAGQMPVAAVAPGSFGASAASAASGTTAGVPTLTIVAGGSTVVQTDFPIKRFALSSAKPRHPYAFGTRSISLPKASTVARKPSRSSTDQR